MKIILVYAECVTSRKGDYVFAAGMARDLKKTMLLSDAWQDTRIILTSSKRGIACFQSLYGDDKGMLRIDGVSLEVMELGAFDPVNNRVTAFINAHRCKYPEAALIKRVLNPDSKVLLLGNANSAPGKISEAIPRYAQEQPGLYEFFNPGQMYLGSVGFGETRIGFGFFEQKTVEPEQPQVEYGFLYLKRMPGIGGMIEQYVALTQSLHYHLVGEFLENEIRLPSEAPKKNGAITIHQTLAHGVMLKLIRQASILVAVTGVASTLEAMLMDKLPFYQDYADSENKPFVTNYLKELHKYLEQYEPDVASKLTLLAGLLFAPKPLSDKDLELLGDFVAKTASEANKALVSQLIRVNKAMLAKERGRAIPTILQFIAKPTPSRISEQSFRVCEILKKPGSKRMMTPMEAMLEAAKSGLLFELKVLVALFSQSRESEKHAFLGMLLLEAIGHKQLDCTRYLLKSGASCTTQNASGQTALDIAKADGLPEMEQLLQNFV